MHLTAVAKDRWKVIIQVRIDDHLVKAQFEFDRGEYFPNDSIQVQRLPIVRGTVLQVVVDHLPDGRKPPKDLWLWHAGPVPADPDLLWKAYLRRPWHPRPDPGKPLSPYKVRLGFRRLRARIGTPADSPKPTHPGPGRPKGSKNRPKSKRPPYRKSKPTTNKHTA